MEPIRGIGFDLDHTLAIDNRLERVALLHLLESMLPRGGHTLGTLSDEIDAIDDLLHRQRCGEFTIDDAVRIFAREHGVTGDDATVEQFRTKCVTMAEDFVVPLPGVAPTIAALGDRGIVVAVLTNGWNPLQRRKAERAGFTGPVLVSSEIGERKPSTAAFERLLQALGTLPAQTWYVGDDPAGDIAGAQQAGMGTVWINWERQIYPDSLRPPDHTIAEFPQLLELLPQIVHAS